MTINEEWDMESGGEEGGQQELTMNEEWGAGTEPMNNDSAYIEGFSFVGGEKGDAAMKQGEKEEPVAVHEQFEEEELEEEGFQEEEVTGNGGFVEEELDGDQTFQEEEFAEEEFVEEELGGDQTFQEEAFDDDFDNNSVKNSTVMKSKLSKRTSNIHDENKPASKPSTLVPTIPFLANPEDSKKSPQDLIKEEINSGKLIISNLSTQRDREQLAEQYISSLKANCTVAYNPNLSHQKDGEPPTKTQHPIRAEALSGHLITNSDLSHQHRQDLAQSYLETFKNNTIRTLETSHFLPKTKTTDDLQGHIE